MTRTKQKINKERQLLKELIDKMFEIAEHDLTFEDVENRTDNWFQQYTMTEEQNKEWKEWGISHLSKKKHFNRYLAERQVAWLDLYCGLKISN